MQIKDYMTTELATLRDDASLAQASQIMKEKRIRQVPVIDGEGQLVGIISKRDVYAASMSNQTENYERTKGMVEGRLAVADIMTKKVATVGATQELSDAAVKLQELRIGALPVLDKGKLVGIISSSDFLGIAVMLLEK